jgi:small-conductance mechanosensitive channel
MTGLNAKIQELSKSKEEAAEKERIAKTAADLNAAMSKRLAEDNQKAADNAKKAADMAAKAKPPEPKAPVSPEDILAAVKAGFNKASEKSTIRTSSIFAKPAVEEKQPTTIEEAKEMTMALIEELNKLGHHYAKLPLDAAKSIEEVLAYKKELQGKLEIYKEASQASGIKQRRT